MVTQYKIAVSSQLDQLEAYVNGLIREGWEPQGGVSVRPGQQYDAYIQAMVKENDV